MGVGVATVSSQIGPGLTTTSLVFNNVTALNYDFVNETVTVDEGGKKTCFDITADSTFTITVSGVTYTITIS